MVTALDPDTSRIDIGTLISAVWRRMGRIVWVTTGLLAITFVVLMFVPKMYESSASILVEPRDSSFLRASNDNTSSGGSVSDDMAIASQVELVQSRDTLLSVIKSQNLTSEAELNTASPGPLGVIMALFGPQKKRDLTEIVLYNVKQRLTVIQERDSRIITVYFRSESPELAARVANAIANAHVSRRAGLVIEDTADASKWLESEIDKMRQKVAEADAKVANFRIENDLYNGADGMSSLIDQQLSDIATQITQSQERQSTATSRAKVLRSLIQKGKPIDSVPAIQDSATIAQLAEQKSNLQSQKAELSARVLPGHPTLVALNAQIDEINNQIALEGKRIADALEAEAEIEETIEASLRDQLTRVKATASGDLTSGVTLAELEREAKAQRDLLETYLVRYRDASARTDVNSALPDVRVVTAAAPSVEPASPKTALILIAVAVIALAGQIGQILFGELVSGRAIVEEGAAPATPVESKIANNNQEVPAAAPVPDAVAPPAAAAEAETQLGLGQTEPEAEVIAAAPTPPPAPPVAAPAPVSVAAQTAMPRRQVEMPHTGYMPAEPPVEPIEKQAVPRPRSLPVSLRPLVDAIIAGRERVVLVAGIGDPDYAEGVMDQLVASCAAGGLGIATVDAASGRVSANPGIGDLLAGAASYGDVVHADQTGHISRVPWGRQPKLDTQSSHGNTLVEALSDIYHVVLIATGTPGGEASLPVFSGSNGYLVIASAEELDAEEISDLAADATVLGFSRSQVVCPGVSDAWVA